MAFADDYLAQLERFGSRTALPAVRALHLPPLAEDPNKKWGEFCAIELSDGSLGLSYVMLDQTLAGLTAQRGSLGIEGADPLRLARGYRDASSGPARALGFAAANALTRCLFERAGYAPQTGGDSIAGLEPEPGDHIGMIGYFAPLADKIVARGARLTVIELRDDLAGPQPGFEITLDAGRLADCNKVLSTSTVLLNDTLDTMLGHCAAARRFAMIGPSAGCLPDGLFRRGVTHLGGSWIEQRADFVEALAKGESWGRFARKTVIAAHDYPGFEALIARLS